MPLLAVVCRCLSQVLSFCASRKESSKQDVSGELDNPTVAELDETNSADVIVVEVTDPASGDGALACTLGFELAAGSLHEPAAMPLSYCVRWRGQQEFCAEVPGDGTLADLKATIEVITQVPASRQRILGFKPVNAPDSTRLMLLEQPKHARLTLIGTLQADVDRLEAHRVLSAAGADDDESSAMSVQQQASSVDGEGCGMVRNSGTDASSVTVASAEEQEGWRGDFCVICTDQKISVCFVPCGHVVVCTSCAPYINPPRCPMCRLTIAHMLHADGGGEILPAIGTAENSSNAVIATEVNLVDSLHTSVPRSTPFPQLPTPLEEDLSSNPSSNNQRFTNFNSSPAVS